MRPLVAFAIVFAALACSPQAAAPSASPTPSATPTPVVVASPGNGGTCSDPVPSIFTCVKGIVRAPSGAAVAGVCVNVGPVANCPFFSDTDGNWRVEVPNGVEFILTFWANGKEQARVDLTPSYLSGGTKVWPTAVVIP